MISLDTDYPFKNTLTYKVCTEGNVKFAFGIRIPSWAKNPTVNGVTVNAGEFYIIDKEWVGQSIITVILPAETEILSWDNNLHSVKSGALLYALKVDSRWKQINYGADEKIRVYPHCDYEIFPKSSFNYAIADTSDIKFTENNISDFVFSEDAPPIYAEIKCRKIKWDKINGVLTETPSDRTPISDIENVKFIPYGCSILRVTVLPVL